MTAAVEQTMTAEKMTMNSAVTWGRQRTGRTVATLVATAVRVILGVLWIHEGVFKWQAGFGKSDILLVVHSTAQNPRVPDFYKSFTADVLGRVPALFGVVVPLIEVGLGVALVLGIVTVPTALASVAQLCNYWLADQLITQYPIMIVLSVVVIAFATVASAYSVTALVLRRRARPIPDAVRRWL